MVNSPDPAELCWTLALPQQTLPQKAARFVDRPFVEIKREVLKAVQECDSTYLWMVTAMHLVVNGARGGRVSQGTLRGYKTGVLKYLTYCRAHDLQILRLSADDPAKYRLYLEEQGATVRVGRMKGLVRGCVPSGVGLNLTSVRSLYRALQWLQVIDHNPFADVKVARTKMAERRSPYPLPDVERLLANASPFETVMVLLGAHAGLRVNEAVDLEWSDVDMHTNVLVVQHGKGDQKRLVPVSASLRRALQSFRAAHRPRKYVLPHRSDVWLRNHMISLCERQQVKYRGYHALRHTAGTRLYMETRELQDVARFLGHDSIETSRIYVHFAEEWNEEEFVI